MNEDIADWFRRIASNEFDKQVNVHVAMDNTLVLDEIRRCCLVALLELMPLLFLIV